LISISPLILVFHGSRSPQSQLAASKLAQLVTEELTSDSMVTQENYLEQQLSFLLSSPTLPRESKDGFLPFPSPKNMATIDRIPMPIVTTAALELAIVPLYQKLIDMARFWCDRGCSKIRILPLFLTPGVHVIEDIPELIALAQQTIGKSIELELLPYLGSYRSLITLLAQQLAGFADGEIILMAHGSRYRQANSNCEQLAASLKATLAYWLIEPSLSQQVRALVDAGKTKMIILPYFLFPGRIFQTIAAQVRELQANFPQVELILTPPLGATPELARLIVKEVVL
jgi:sirohydrochlorin ferrochelatase